MPVEISVAAYGGDHHTVTRVILKERVSSVAGDIKWSGTFQVKKALQLPIFDKNGRLPDDQRSEREIEALLRDVYGACVSSNKSEFLRIVLEGYSYHSPAECQDVMSAMGSMFESLKLKPFPDKFYFIHGNNLIRAYSDIVDGRMVLFESSITNSGSIGCIDFAHIDGRWIVW